MSYVAEEVYGGDHEPKRNSKPFAFGLKFAHSPASGEVYYYHKETQKSQFEMPKAASQHREPQTDPKNGTPAKLTSLLHWGT